MYLNTYKYLYITSGFLSPQPPTSTFVGSGVLGPNGAYATGTGSLTDLNSQAANWESLRSSLTFRGLADQNSTSAAVVLSPRGTGLARAASVSRALVSGSAYSLSDLNTPSGIKSPSALKLPKNLTGVPSDSYNAIVAGIQLSGTDPIGDLISGSSLAADTEINDTIPATVDSIPVIVPRHAFLHHNSTMNNCSPSPSGAIITSAAAQAFSFSALAATDSSTARLAHAFRSSFVPRTRSPVKSPVQTRDRAQSPRTNHASQQEGGSGTVAELIGDFFSAHTIVPTEILRSRAKSVHDATSISHVVRNITSDIVDNTIGDALPTNICDMVCTLKFLCHRFPEK